MNSQRKHKLIKSLKRVSLADRIAGLASIVGVGALISVWVLPPPNSNSPSQAKHKHSNTAQISSKAIANSGNTSTVDSSAVTKVPLTLPETIRREALDPTLILPPLDSATVVDGALTLPKTSTTNSTSTPPSTASIPSRYLPPANRTTNPNKFSIPPSTTSIPSRYLPPLRTTKTTSKSVTATQSLNPARTASRSNRYIPPANSKNPLNDASTANKLSTPSRAIASNPSPASIANRYIPRPSRTTQPDRVVASKPFIPPSRTTTFRLLTPQVKVEQRTLIAANSPAIATPQYSQPGINDANAIALGLVVAKRQGQIKPYTRTWRKAQDAIFLLRRGKTRSEAARRAGISLSVLTQLINWGQNQPSKTKLQERTLIAANSPAIATPQYSQPGINDANAVALGLVVAKRQGQIKPYTRTWRKAQDAIFLLRRGKTRPEAARRAGISLSVLTQLIDWGQQKN